MPFIFWIPSVVRKGSDFPNRKKLFNINQSVFYLWIKSITICTFYNTFQENIIWLSSHVAMWMWAADIFIFNVIAFRCNEIYWFQKSPSFKKGNFVWCKNIYDGIFKRKFPLCKMFVLQSNFFFWQSIHILINICQPIPQSQRLNIVKGVGTLNLLPHCGSGLPGWIISRNPRHNDIINPFGLKYHLTWAFLRITLSRELSRFQREATC